jgi:hypothetical protein
MKKIVLMMMVMGLVVGCAPVRPPQWDEVSTVAEKEYTTYMKPGTATLTGQAFLVQNGGQTVKAAGQTVTLDPATTIGTEWWQKAGNNWEKRNFTHPSQIFTAARKTTTADAEGRFKFKNLAPGKYYVRTDITWMAGGYYGIQGGLVGGLIDVKDSQENETILNKFAM